MKRSSFLCCCFMGVLSLVHLAGCSRESPPFERRSFREAVEKDNVVVILIDTLRADHLPFYGYPRDTAPFLSSLASRGVVFETAFASSASTAPSVSSLFTSLFPAEHGVVTGKVTTRRLMKTNTTLKMNRLPEAIDTMAELFKERGFRTFGLSDNPQVAADVGFAQGFDRFEMTMDLGAKKMNQKLATWAAELKNSGRYFLYLQYMDPHDPYRRRKPWYVKGQTKQESIVNAYDSEIRFTDEAIRELFGLLELDRNALVVVLSDHGEEFWEHGNRGHGINLYTQVTRVPLLLFHRDLPAARISEPASLVDILPTLADWIGIPSHPQWRGISLSGARPGRNQGKRDIYSELLRYAEDKRPASRAVAALHHHFIETENREGPGKEELYNLSTDPAELKDISPTDSRLQSQLRARLGAVVERHRPIPAEKVELELDEAETEKLKTLGYFK